MGSLVVFICLFAVSAGLSCKPCEKDICEIGPHNVKPTCYKERVPCPDISPDCTEKVPDECGCCDVCAGQVGESCSVFSRKCAKGLKCTGKVNGFNGTCRPTKPPEY